MFIWWLLADHLSFLTSRHAHIWRLLTVNPSWYKSLWPLTYENKSLTYLALQPLVRDQRNPTCVSRLFPAQGSIQERLLLRLYHTTRMCMIVIPCNEGYWTEICFNFNLRWLISQGSFEIAQTVAGQWSSRVIFHICIEIHQIKDGT